MFEEKKVGLVLGGGGARGLAHIGVLKVLEDNNIPIHMISGTSIGAVIGALYSSEPNAKKLEKEALETNWNDLFDYTISRSGLIKGKRIEEFLENKLNNIKFNQLKIPLYITAFDIDNAQEIIFSKGEVSKAVRSSISIPGIFIPVENGGRTLVDGGVIDPLPIEILKKKKADIIIVVNVDSAKEKPAIEGIAIDKKGKKVLPNLFKILQKSSFMLSSKVCNSQLTEQGADWVISPNLSKISSLDFSRPKKIIRRGEREAKKSIKRIRKLTEPNAFKDFLLNLKEDIKEDIMDIKKEINN